MKEYIVITYRLTKSVNPSVVLQTIEEILQKRDVHYQNCLFKMSIPIIEDKESFHSSRKKNAILSICKSHPVFQSFFEYMKFDESDDHIDETLCLNNFSDLDYSQKGKIEYPILRDVVTKIPRLYALNSLELVFDDIHFTKEKSGEFII